jgi:hypothetical protein
MSVYVTDHAIKRYIERVEQCSREDAVERITHAVQIAKKASPAMVWRWASRPNRRQAVYLYCKEANLFLVCLNDTWGGLSVLTLFECNGQLIGAKAR